MEIHYSSRVSHSFEKLPRVTQELAVTKIKKFKLNPFNPSLKTHKLSGNLQGNNSFSINYSLRIVFRFIEKDAYFIDIGSHSIYR